jgi:murein L,D-transpeptidase YafK
VVKKADKKLFLVKNGVPIQEYTIALGPKPKGHKREEGDERTPEGSYILDFKNADSDFYKSIHISYPNQRDKQLAAINGVDPGGSIMIHGLPNTSTIDPALAQRYNWTDGCIAVTNNEMDEIWHAVEAGTPIDILP